MAANELRQNQEEAIDASSEEEGQINSQDLRPNEQGQSQQLLVNLLDADNGEAMQPEQEDQKQREQRERREQQEQQVQQQQEQQQQPPLESL